MNFYSKEWFRKFQIYKLNFESKKKVYENALYAMQFYLETGKILEKNDFRIDKILQYKRSSVMVHQSPLGEFHISSEKIFEDVEAVTQIVNFKDYHLIFSGFNSQTMQRVRSSRLDETLKQYREQVCRGIKLDTLLIEPISSSQIQLMPEKISPVYNFRIIVGKNTEKSQLNYPHVRIA